MKIISQFRNSNSSPSKPLQDRIGGAWERVFNMSEYALFIRSMITQFIGQFDYIFGQMPGVFILAYHSIDEDGWRFSTPLSEFEKQIEYLMKVANPIELSDIEKFVNGKKKIEHPSFVITFDDGYKNILQSVEVLKKYNIKPTVFLIGDTKNYNQEVLGTDKKLLSKSDVQKLVKNGWKIGSHTMTHSFLTKSTDLENELLHSKKVLKNYVGNNIKYISYPKGDYNSRVIDEVKSVDYILGLTMDIGYVLPNSDPMKLPRIGVDGSHSFNEFKYLFFPSVVFGKGIIQRFMRAM